MWTPAHTYLHTNSFVHTENVFRSALQNTGKLSELSATLLQRLQASPSAPSLLNTEQRRPALAAFSNNNAVFFLDQSIQHFDIGPYKTTFRKHRSNIGSHIYVACLTTTFVLCPLYPSRPMESASCRPTSWWLSVLHSIYLESFYSVLLQTQETSAKTISGRCRRDHLWHGKFSVLNT